MLKPSDRLLSNQALTPEQRVLFDWFYERDRGGPVSIVLNAIAWGVADEHPDWTFWNVMAEAHRRFDEHVKI
jgi:hypothetical protein